MQVRRVLAILPNWVGDVVMATPALRAIRARFREAQITYLQRAYLGELLAGCGWFDAVEHWPEGVPASLFAQFALARRLRRSRPDLAILFPNSLRSALLARMSRAQRRVGYSREGRGLLLTERLEPRRNGHGFVPLPMVDYYRDLVQAAGCRVDDPRLELCATPTDEARLDERLGASDQRPIAVLNPGASYGLAKCWPAERYAMLADRLTSRHGLRVVATCGPAERAVADALCSAAREPLTVFIDPPLGLGPLKALVRRSRLMVTNDTGPRHIAAAFNTPVVTIFGSSDPAWTETGHPLERKVMISLECQPCMQRVCPLGHHNCMQLVTVDMVMEAAEELMRLDSTTPALAGGRTQPEPC